MPQWTRQNSRGERRNLWRAEGKSREESEPSREGAERAREGAQEERCAWRKAREPLPWGESKPCRRGRSHGDGVEWQSGRPASFHGAPTIVLAVPRHPRARVTQFRAPVRNSCTPFSRAIYVGPRQRHHWWW